MNAHADRPARPLLRGLAIALVAALIAAVAAGCGDEGSAGPYANNAGSLNANQQKEDYAAALDRMMTTMEDPSAPPLERSIAQAQRRELTAMALRWDQALATIEDAKPPKEAQAAHEQLVQAMRSLSAWNNRIARSAPNKSRTKRVAKKAQKSEAAAQFSDAIKQLEQLGYLPEDPWATAGSPVQ